MSLTLLAGCGGKAGAEKATGGKLTPSAVIPTATSESGGAALTPALTATSVAPTATPTARASATATAAPRATTAPQPAAPVLVSAAVRPIAAGVGAPLSATVVTRGDVSRVELYIGSGSPGASGPATLSMSESSAGIWNASTSAPAVAGEYHFTVGLFGPNGRRTMVDRDGWNIEVTGAPTAPPAPVAQPLPGDIPLAPPFSYGNPVAATFNAMGRSVPGSEVMSNARPDVPGSAVGDFYNTHLPRAGWTLTSPAPAGASTFTVVATSGTRVVVVDFSAATVHIFYGALSG